MFQDITSQYDALMSNKMSHKGYIKTCDLTFPFFPKSFDQYYIERADFECFFGRIPCQPLSIIASTINPSVSSFLSKFWILTCNQSPSLRVWPQAARWHLRLEAWPSRFRSCCRKQHQHQKDNGFTVSFHIILLFRSLGFFR